MPSNNVFGLNNNSLAGTKYLEEKQNSNDFVTQMLYNYQGLSPIKTPIINTVFNNTDRNIDILAPLTDTDKLYNLRQQELDILKDAYSTKKGLDIYNTTMGSLTGLTNFGLGIWNAVENNKNLKKQREVADKQIALADEQILASQQYRNERAKEIERLNRVRSNTTKAFNTGSVITRSY